MDTLGGKGLSDLMSDTASTWHSKAIWVPLFFNLKCCCYRRNPSYLFDIVLPIDNCCISIFLIVYGIPFLKKESNDV